ncbi:hypothetical protein L596_014710 [Steinernema carpocapsae]|uniref:G-protein coupled receptors family 1 profile domain-containing protein n=1 Tax=Steinernema carpocapsae TaxID=34508 RepID=A0A4U5ND80_STECR|nr:hypothetical protein L596_014710 [Steinernema carpocapsae]
MVILEDYVAAFVMFLISVLGLVVNLVAIVFVRRTKALRNVFGSLCLSHAAADIGILLCFLLYAVPVTILPESISAFSAIAIITPRVGQISILLWNVCVYSHLFIAANRFLVICFPFRVQALSSSSQKSSKLLFFAVEGCVWCFGLGHSIPYSWPQCGFEYDPKNQLWNFAFNDCGDTLMHIDFVEGLTCISVIVLLNFATFLKIRFGKVSVVF